jgi:hypothetical protein
LVRFFEILFLTIKNLELPQFYNAYGLDLKANKKNLFAFIPAHVFKKQLKRVNSLYHDGSERLLLLNPTVFKDFYSDFPILKYLGIIKKGEIFINRKLIPKHQFLATIGKDVRLDSLYLDPPNTYFFAHRDEKHEKLISSDHLSFSDVIMNNSFVIYEKNKLASLIQKIHPTGALEINVITLRDGDDIKAIKTYLIVSLEEAPKRIAFIDNALYVNIKEKGELDEYGYTHPSSMNLKFLKQPLSGITFSEIKIPNFKKIVEIAINAHHRLPTLNVIKWSFTIFEKEITLLRGTPRFDVAELQMNTDGQRQFWTNYYKRTKNAKKELI